MAISNFSPGHSLHVAPVTEASSKELHVHSSPPQPAPEPFTVLQPCTQGEVVQTHTASPAAHAPQPARADSRSRQPDMALGCQSRGAGAARVGHLLKPSSPHSEPTPDTFQPALPGSEEELSTPGITVKVEQEDAPGWAEGSLVASGAAAAVDRRCAVSRAYSQQRRLQMIQALHRRWAAPRQPDNSMVAGDLQQPEAAPPHHSLPSHEHPTALGFGKVLQVAPSDGGAALPGNIHGHKQVSPWQSTHLRCTVSAWCAQSTAHGTGLRSVLVSRARIWVAVMTALALVHAG
jgi:hypothetical protein